MINHDEFERFRTLVAGMFEAEPGEIGRSTTAADIDGWDSVSHTTLIMAVEDAYAVRFPDAEIFGFKNVGALFDRTMELRQI